ncbi:DUF721 domain-containing protein [Pseudahrensia aquimaris]|uniref:DUF721 domain-containing protein n=1 Tax=Pseudahrensia aquimaris TaxID=744461 RepID=A0ABW3FGI1_9HYPH
MSERDKKQDGFVPRGARPVADLVSKLLNPVIERRAGMTLDLLSVWEEIVGERHAEHSRPEKLNWPRKHDDDDPFEPATLIVACEGHHALFLQHDSDGIVKRVNAYFGFAAVAKLKLVQKPLTRTDKRKRRRAPQVEPDQARRIAEIVENVDDPHLKSALEKLGRGVFSKGS